MGTTGSAGRPAAARDDALVGRESERAVLDRMLSEPGVVLLIDTFEQCRSLEAWLRDTFLPGLADSALRAPPRPSRSCGWTRRCRRTGPRTRSSPPSGTSWRRALRWGRAST